MCLQSALSFRVVLYGLRHFGNMDVLRRLVRKLES